LPAKVLLFFDIYKKMREIVNKKSEIVNVYFKKKQYLCTEFGIPVLTNAKNFM